MKLYSYIVAADSGFAPNPFNGVLTLACCKPMIRRSAGVGDWVVGLSGRGERVVYAMHVAEVFSFNDYWADPRFQRKKPDRSSPSAAVRRGDNIYEPYGMGTFRQLPSSHSKRDGTENLESLQHDLGGRHVLVAHEFVYFGGDGPELPPELGFLVVGRGHRCHFSTEQVEMASRWLASQARGIQGRPARWPAEDESWGEDL